VSEDRGLEATKRCVGNFIRLFKKDCKPVLHETNEYFQMMKLRATQHLGRMPTLINRDSDNELEEEGEVQLSFGGSGRDLSSGSANSKKNKPITVLFEENQFILRYNKPKVEVDYLKRIEDIINGSKANYKKNKKSRYQKL
jgi:hypothetical protein